MVEPVGTEQVSLATFEVHTDGINGCVDHLAADGAFPDQVIEFELLRR